MNLLSNSCQQTGKKSENGKKWAHPQTPLPRLRKNFFYYCDTIRYDAVDLRALKSWRDGQLNLAHGPETKNNEQIKIKNRVAQKIRCRRYNLFIGVDKMCVKNITVTVSVRVNATVRVSLVLLFLHYCVG